MEFIEGTLTLRSHLLLRGQDKSFSNLYAETSRGTGLGGEGLGGGGERIAGEHKERCLYVWRVEGITEKTTSIIRKHNQATGHHCLTSRTLQ